MCLFCRSQRKIFWRMWETEQFWAPLTSIVFFSYWKSMVPQNNLVTNFLQNIFLCVQNKDRFGTTWGWVNDDRIFSFGWTTPLTTSKHLNKQQYLPAYTLLKYSQRNVDFWFHKQIIKSEFWINKDYCELLWCFYQLFGFILTAPIHCRGSTGEPVM